MIVSAERIGNQILVRWEAEDAHPDWSSFHLEYCVAVPWAGGLQSGATKESVNSSSQQFVAVPVKAGRRGEITFRPGQAGPVILRLRLKDLAGHGFVTVIRNGSLL